MKPKIGVVPNRKDKLGTDYAEKLKNAGAEPVVLPVTEFREPLLKILKKVQGILLPGGGDFSDPYYEDLTPEKIRTLRDVDKVREQTEWLALDFAREHGRPVFGICRGMQAINAHAGGTLMADMVLELRGTEIPEHRPDKPGAKLPDHEIGFDPQTTLGKLASLSSVADHHEERVWLTVNNSHHQAVSRLGKGLRAAAWAQDGVIEAIESEETASVFWFGVQFHPERMNSDFSRRLFELFVKTVRNY